MYFPQDEEKRLSLRTARDYLKLAGNWPRLCDKHPDGFASQRQAMKALAAIDQADRSDPDGANSAARCRIGDGAEESGVTALTRAGSQQQRKKKRTRTGPVWRASGPFVSEAYMRVARQVPASTINATSVSPKSQAAVLRAMRGEVFTGSGDAVAGAPSLADPTAACDADATAHRRLAFVAARRLRKLADWLVAIAAGAPAAELAVRINALATDLLLDSASAVSGVGASTSGEVYFIEAVGAERMLIPRNVAPVHDMSWR